MSDTKIAVKLNENEVVEAIEYMYGISYKEANRKLKERHYTREEVYKAVSYFRTVGLPTEMKSDRAKKELPEVIKTYENLIQNWTTRY